jgi:hypothetical protein
MGYLDNSSITVDAILTKKGRELLARGQNEFVITQFALADDEIDYGLYNTEHPLGTAYYGAAIENMPIVEALPDETLMMKYKLVTLPRGTVRIPVITVATTEVTLEPGQSFTFFPQTINFSGGNAQYGYTSILANSDAGTIVATQTAQIQSGPTIPQFIGDNEAAQSVTIVGREFTFTAANLITPVSTTIMIIGNETGGRVTITIHINPIQLNNMPQPGPVAFSAG